MRSHLLCVTLLLTLGLFGAEPGLVRSAFIFETNPVPSCHATTIVEARDGSLVAAWFAGEAEGKPDVSIWVARQVDGKWSAPVKVAEGLQPDGKRFPCWNPVLFQPKDGPLQLYYKVGPNPVEWWGLLRLSDDNGKTWGEPRRLPEGILGPIKNKPVQLKDGTILSGSSAEGLKVGPSWQIHFERSRDNGVTWEKIKVDQGQGSPASIQPSILFLKDGSLMSLGRTRNGKVFSTLSSDQGTSWSKVELIDLPNPNSGTDAVTLKDGRHLLIYNHTAKGRSPLNLAVSKDGITWEAAMVLEDEPKAEFSYPAIIQSSDGLVHITYTWKRKLAKHVVVDPSKIVSKPMDGLAWPKSAEAQGGQAGLERLKYNNPGLVVDLGVGLWAWPLPMDVDGDGKYELVVNCPDKPSNGVYVFRADADTAKRPLPVFKPGVRISKGMQNVELSWGADGKPRVLSPGVEYPEFARTGLESGKKLPIPSNVHPNKVRANMWKYADYDGDGRTDVIIGVGDWTDYGWDNAYNTKGVWIKGPLRGYVYVVRNEGSNEQPKYGRPAKVVAAGKDLEVFGWPSPNFADFDGDGDLDLLCGEFLDGFTYFENIGSRTEPSYSAGRRLTLPPEITTGARSSAWKATAEAKKLPGSPRALTMDLEMITPVAFDWNKDGKLDLVVGDEDGRVAFIENTGKFTADHTPLFLPPKYFKQQADDIKFGALATPVGFDWDGDGDVDIISGNTAGYVAFFENLSGSGVAKPKFAAPKLLQADGKTLRIMAGQNGSIQGPAEAKWGYTTQTVADWDGDGLPDLIVNSILGKVVWYRNIGTRKEPKLAAAAPVEVEWQGAQPELAWGWMKPQGKALLTQWRTTPVAVDWNKDGLTDLVMLDQEGYLAYFERAKIEGKLVLLAPRRAFCGEDGKPLQLSKGTAGKSGRRKLCVTDWDGDGKADFLLNSSSANLLRQVGFKDGCWLFKDEGPLVKQNIEGHDVSPTTVDFDADGVPDFLGGAEDGKFYYLRNPRSAAAR
ncbi:MAG: exo-alpha-sialidase [Opitutales bacterium]